MFIVVCGVSGVGKSTLIRNLNSKIVTLPRSVTTRLARPSDPKSEYVFVNHHEFNCLKAQNQLLIHQYFHQDQYGILKNDYDKIMADGKVAIKDIGYDGILQLRAKLDEVPCIYIDSSLDVLEERLRKRGDSYEQIRERFSMIKQELEDFRSVADYEIENNSSIEEYQKQFQKVLGHIIGGRK
ncbi:MAG: AAA family ATPase [Bacilli bacterium]|jgi:guanylate kinase|nr:AAA family ATPase [Bacilli bacterium]